MFGNDYDTKDGTGVRDFIHVVDLAKGHLAALKCIENIDGCKVIVTVSIIFSYIFNKSIEFQAINLGTGTGYSVLEAVRAFEKASGKQIPFQFAPRRPGSCFIRNILVIR